MTTQSGAIDVRVLAAADCAKRQPALREFLQRTDLIGCRTDLRWLDVLREGLRHETCVLEASRGDRVVGLLPLAHVKSFLFGSFLVSLPYLNMAGTVAEDATAAERLIGRAVELANVLDVRYLELRHGTAFSHPALTHQSTSKVLMQFRLPTTAEELWDGFTPKVRNQIRKAEKQTFSIHWGAAELLADFYDVFSRNMRNLGTPVFSRRLFQSILANLSDRAEICSMRDGSRPIAAALLIHGDGASEVPSASSLRAYNPTNANMLMYWNLLQRAVSRGQKSFDFGRSSVESNTFRFKKQWGARPEPTVWQYYVREGDAADMRPESGKYNLMIKLWRRLPLFLTRLAGPAIIRGIP